jgi:hypothetical protein
LLSRNWSKAFISSSWYNKMYKGFKNEKMKRYNNRYINFLYCNREVKNNDSWKTMWPLRQTFFKDL